jgi:hypothetical protein
MRVGINVYCTVCGQPKAPVGRSVPLGISLCFYDCFGYMLDPQAGSLWPGETEEEFGYPVSPVGTAEINPAHPSALKGIESTYVYLDEAGLIDDVIWESIADGKATQSPAPDQPASRQEP